MTKHVQSPGDNLRVTAVHWDRSVMDGRSYRLKGCLKGFITICSRAQFEKSSVLMKKLMKLKLKWPQFSRVNNFPGERNYPRTLLYFTEGKIKTVLGSGDGKGGGKPLVEGTVT